MQCAIFQGDVKHSSIIEHIQYFCDKMHEGLLRGMNKEYNFFIHSRSDFAIKCVYKKIKIKKNSDLELRISELQLRNW